MKELANGTARAAGRQKAALLFLFYVLSSCIMASGLFFTVYSLAMNITIKVLSVPMPGFVFGLLVAYLGLRYFLQVRDLRRDLCDPSAKFSWSNFRFRKNSKKRKIS